MDYPILEYFEDEIKINKQLFVKGCIEKNPNMQKVLDLKVDTAILLFSKTADKYAHLIKDCYKVFDFLHGSNINKGYLYKDKIMFVLSPLGGPSAASLMEELGMLGIKNFIACGSAGAISDKADMSSLFIVDRAIRDEGTSYQYIPASVYIKPDTKLTQFLEDYLNRRNINYKKGTVWTTDSYYRETPLRVSARLAQGATAVDMECATWCAVAKRRGFKFAQLLFFSDLVDLKGSETPLKRKQIKTYLIDLVIEAGIYFQDVKNQY